MDSIKGIRNIRAEMNIVPSKRISATVQLADWQQESIFAAAAGYFNALAGIDNLQLEKLQEQKPADSVSVILGSVEIYIPLKGLLDIDKEIERLGKELANMHKEVSRLDGKLSNESFVAKAPPDVIAKEREKLQDYQGKYNAIKERIGYFEQLR